MDSAKLETSPPLWLQHNYLHHRLPDLLSDPDDNLPHPISIKDTSSNTIFLKPFQPTFNASLHKLYTINSKFTYIEINCFLY
jgi:hypothetical protein